MPVVPATPESYERGGRSIAWVLKSSDKFVLGSCDVNPQKFEGSGAHGDMSKVYVVLDQIGKDKEKELSFGLKIVDGQGKQLASESNNALIVTNNSVGLINIQGWFSISGRNQKGEINERTEGILRKAGIKTEFQANASNVDIWLKGGSGVNEEDWGDLLKENGEVAENWQEGKADGKERLEGLMEKLKRELKTKDEQTISSLFSSMWFDNKKAPTEGWITITAEWNPWCGTQDNKYDKRLKEDGDQSELVGGGYKNAKGNINLRVGPIRNSRAEDKWALIPIGKPIMKINLSSGSFNNETIEGTLELINNFLIIFYFLYVKKQWNLSYKLRYFTHILSSNKSADLKIFFRSTEPFLIEWSKLS